MKKSNTIRKWVYISSNKCLALFVKLKKSLTNLRNKDLYFVTEASLRGNNLFCGNNTFLSDDGIHIRESIKSYAAKLEVFIILKHDAFKPKLPRLFFSEFFHSLHVCTAQ